VHRLIDLLFLYLYIYARASLVDPIHDFIGQCELRADGSKLNLVQCLLLVVTAEHHLPLELLPKLSLELSESFVL
jgi:hypothetical protein